MERHWPIYSISACKTTARFSRFIGFLRYFALAMGRIGADFRSLLSHAFEQRLVSMISRLIATATERFLARLERKTAIPAP